MQDTAPVSRRTHLIATIGKLAIAVLVFVTIVGGSFVFQQSRAAERLILPGAAAATRCSIWFVGSSTIHKWQTLARDMRPWDAHNRGIDGANLPDISTALGNEPSGQKPAAIVLYAGENDIAHGQTAEQTIAALKTFLAVQKRTLPGIPVLVMGMKPSPTRWTNRPTQLAYNRMAMRIVAADPMLAFVDPGPTLLRDGHPGPFYVADGIHLNTQGYSRLADMIRPALARFDIPRCDAAG